MTKEIVWQRRKEDFIVDWFNGEGKGGQHRNKKKCYCHLTDKATGIQTSSQEFKSASQNKKVAFLKMVALLRSHYEGGSKERRSLMVFGGERVRTYSEPDNRVVDTAGGRYSYTPAVGRGDLAGPITGRLKSIAISNAGGA